MPPADLVLQLDVSLEEAVKRNNLRDKPGKETEAELRERFRVNTGVVFNADKVVVVDTDDNLESVHREIRTIIWRHILDTN